MRDYPHQTVLHLDLLGMQRFNYLGSSGYELHSVQKTLRNVLLPYLRPSITFTSFCHTSNVFLPHFFLQHRSHARALSHAIDITYRPHMYKNLPIINYNKIFSIYVLQESRLNIDKYKARLIVPDIYLFRTII
jgi:hypothetical protein